MTKTNKIIQPTIDKVFERDKKLFFKKCKNRAELQAWVRYYLNLDLPDTVVSRYATTTPLDIVWELYKICVLNDNPEDIQELLYTGARGSGKCVERGTVVLTKTGPKYIENITINDHVHSGYGFKKVKETFNEGIKSGVKVSTKKGKKYGTSLSGSLKHRIQAIDPETGLLKWTYIKDLKKDQIVYKGLNKVVINNTSKDYIDGWLIGNIVGDGCVSNHGNSISLASQDMDQLNYYCDQVEARFGIRPIIKKSTRGNYFTAKLTLVSFRTWFHTFIDGEYCYFKKLKTLEHSNDFLSGFFAGMMETDGSKGSITLANPEMIRQLQLISTILGVHTVINRARRPKSKTKFIKDHVVEYHELKFVTPLHQSMMPMFSKEIAFLKHAAKNNSQFRYPKIIMKPFIDFFRKKYKPIKGRFTGYYKTLDDGSFKHINVKFRGELKPTEKDGHIYGHKIDSFIELCEELNEEVWRDYLIFLRNGVYENVDSIEYGDFYFYDLEVEDDHSYWSNGYVSHNTLGVTIAEFIIMLHDQRDVCHVGAIMANAARSYQYFQSFCMMEKVKKIIDPPGVKDTEKVLQKSTMSKSVFNVNNIQCSMEILPATLKALNGAHVQLVSVDELDVLAGEGLRAIKEVAGMLDTKRGKRPLRVGISTRKTKYGLMNSMIENADKEGRHLRFWTALEFTERCPDSRSGTVPTPLWLSQDTGESFTQEEFEKIAANKKQGFIFEAEGMFDKCKSCPAAAFCRGDAKKQTSKSNMLKTMSEHIQKIRSEGIEWAASQLYNLKPSTEGLVYPEFEERIHVKTWNEMWFKLVGKEFPGECTHDIFVKKCHEMRLPIYAGVDWGFSNPSAVVFFAADSRDNLYVIRTDAMTHVSDPTWIHHIKTKYHNMYRCQLYFPDTAAMGSLQEMTKAGLPVCNTPKGEIGTGIQVIKKFLRVPGTSDTKLLIAKETNPFLINELSLYHYKADAAGTITDDPEGENDHSLDALRYAMAQLYGKTNIILGGGLEFDSAEGLVDGTGNYSRTPTAVEYAASKGISFNQNEQDLSKLGKIGTVSDLDKQEEDDTTSSGGFIWSL